MEIDRSITVTFPERSTAAAHDKERSPEGVVILIETGIARGRKTTPYKSIKTDVLNSALSGTQVEPVRVSKK